MIKVKLPDGCLLKGPTVAVLNTEQDQIIALAAADTVTSEYMMANYTCTRGIAGNEYFFAFGREKTNADV